MAITNENELREAELENARNELAGIESGAIEARPGRKQELIATLERLSDATQISITNGNHSSPVLGFVEYDQISNWGHCYATSRVLQGTEDTWAAQEWAQEATLPDGRKGRAIFLFSAEDIRDQDGNEFDDADMYPFDAAHCARFVTD